MPARPGVPTHPTADAGFAVYVHWPFCLAKCPYCDFNSHVRLQPPDQQRYIAAFRREIAHRAALAPAGPPPMMATSKTSLDLENIGDLPFYCIVARYV